MQDYDGEIPLPDVELVTLQKMLQVGADMEPLTPLDVLARAACYFLSEFFKKELEGRIEKRDALGKKTDAIVTEQTKAHAEWIKPSSKAAKRKK